MTTTNRERYYELVRTFPLRPIRSRTEYRQAAAMLDGLATRDEADLDQGERDYLLVLADLIEAYDAQHHRLGLARKPPLHVLRYLMKESGLTVADLGRIIGNKTAASLILAGKRQLSKRHIVKLSEYFNVEAGLFLSP